MACILIDLQGAQTESRLRGIGRYTIALTLAMIRESRDHDIHILLSKAFPETIIELRCILEEHLPDEKIHFFDTVTPTTGLNRQNAWRSAASALLREAFIEGLHPDVVFCPSLFEGFIDDAVLSVRRFSSIPVVVTLHDLIPLIYKENYLSSGNGYEAFYYNKVEEIKKADGLLTISESSSSEAVSLLGFSRDKVLNASEAADAKFCKKEISDARAKLLLKNFGIDKPFLFYTGGADHRKNLDRLLSAFATLPSALRDGYQLVMAGRMPDGEIWALKEQAKRLEFGERQLLFTGYVSDDDLIELYNLARAFVFPSLHEGFGLPVLEAMQCGTPVIGANISSVPEVLGNSEALFDPTSVKDIAYKIEHVLNDDAFRERLIKHGHEQANRFSWQTSAQRALEGIARFASEPQTKELSWADIRGRLESCESRLIAAILAIDPSIGRPEERDLLRLSQAIADNRRAVEERLRLRTLPKSVRWRLEGPFDSSYSLALVNREMARSLSAHGESVDLWSSEGPGDFPPSKQFLIENADLRSMYDRASTVASDQVDIVSRNMYPPRVADMIGKFNALHNYAWEETGFPEEFVRSFNESLQFATVTSQHVRKLLIDNGVSIPLAVVGNGVDHWVAVNPDQNYSVAKRGFTFLHVSSCFPRKGADVLLESYGRAFTSKDDVILIVKTFRNPHNEIEHWLEEARARHPDYPDITIIFDDLTDAQMKAVYSQSDVLVAPSRAEGYGLPLAEAALSGTAVITTGWSGQLDFCDSTEVDLIDFNFVPAATHSGVQNSVWAEPDPDHLARVMRKVFAEPAEQRQARTSAFRKRLLESHKWSNVAARQIEAARRFVSNPCFSEPKIGWVTTYNQRCGIATYSNHLLQVLGMPVLVLAPKIHTALGADSENVIRCWKEGNDDDLTELAQQIELHKFDIVVLQFNYGFYNIPHLCSFLNRIMDFGTQVVITLHATVDPEHDKEKRLADLKPALLRCQRILVHSINDLNRLKNIDILDNVALLPHGVLSSADPVSMPVPYSATSDSQSSFVIAAYGFFLPNKGIPELIEALRILRRNGIDYRLRLVNAEYPAPVSAELIAEAKALARRLGLLSAIEFYTDFLPDEESLHLLSSADLIAYTYQNTAESASGAVRYGIATGKPVAVTPLSIFDDVSNAVFQLPGVSPLEIAAGLSAIRASIGAGDERFRHTMNEARRWRQAHSYPAIGRRLAGMLKAMHQEKFHGTHQ
ncbi:glycosyltransferase [Agrobacterium rhizogenes]|uniref:glycosyltransferase n=1 Tax=Rhizobium rhizogenes TaxID=359 RepID=UPI001571FD4F|nr:glycosyltransferase [Rhizobium rhizogenes]NTI17590.1 glycosyltransferase [Rhizobium rhizogenes]